VAGWQLAGSQLSSTHPPKSKKKNVNQAQAGTGEDLISDSADKQRANQRTKRGQVR